MLSKIINFKESTEFTNAIKLAIAAVIPVLLFSHLGKIDVGITIGLGAFFVFQSDVPSILKHKTNGLIVCSLIISGVNLLINLSFPYLWLFFPTLCVLLFSVSMLAVYDQRATTIAFSSLLSISLSFSHIYTTYSEIFVHAGLLLSGGLFYLLISVLFHFIKPNRYIELQITECMRLTAKYLKFRGDLWEIDSDRDKITKKQLSLQVDLNTIHENVRDILIRNRTNYGASNQNRRMLLSLISLVEIMELALSTSFDHQKLHQKFDNHPIVLNTYQNLAYNLGKSLKKLSKSILNQTKYVSKHCLTTDLEQLKLAIDNYKTIVGQPEAIEGVLMLTTMLKYAEKQVEKIKILEKAYTKTVLLKDLNGRDKEVEKLIHHPYYPLSTLVENLSFSSIIFRHSLRITITVLTGYLLGMVLPFQNVYWILLTIVVIMRPGYGLTKERTYNRFIGTIAGGIIAFSILACTQNTTTLGALAVISMILGFSFNPTNYKIGTTFITIYVVFLFAILTPDIENLTGYRILATVLGVILGVLANNFLWPFWEFLNIPEYLEKAIVANRNYIKEFSNLYNIKGETSQSYRLARNQAFIEAGNLMASFQRMVQEPKSKQNKLPLYYKLTVLNHTLLSSAASLGTYTQSNQTTEASEAFNKAINKIINKLDYAILLLKNNQKELAEIDKNNDQNENFDELKKIKSRELELSLTKNQNQNQEKVQEAQLVIEQLIWVTNLTENIVKTTERVLSE